MNDADFHAQLSKFSNDVHAAAAGPQGSTSGTAETARDLVAESRARQDKLRETVKTLQESLDHLRLSVKYLVFDLEATRRENDYLRKLLEASRD